MAPISKCFRKGLFRPALLILPLLEDTAFLNMPNSEDIHGQLIVTPSARGLGIHCQFCSPMASSRMPQDIAQLSVNPLCPFSCQCWAPEGGQMYWRSGIPHYGKQTRLPTCWLVKDLCQNRSHALHPRSSLLDSCQEESLGVCVHTCWDGGTPGLAGCWLSSVPKAATRWEGGGWVLHVVL